MLKLETIESIWSKLLFSRSIYYSIKKREEFHEFCVEYLKEQCGNAYHSRNVHKSKAIPLITSIPNDSC